MMEQTEKVYPRHGAREYLEELDNADDDMVWTKFMNRAGRRAHAADLRKQNKKAKNEH